MGRDVCFLLTLVYESQGTLMRCAVSVPSVMVPPLVFDAWNEPESRKWLHGLLPLHCRNVGPVVEAEMIFAVAVVERPEEERATRHVPVLG